MWVLPCLRTIAVFTLSHLKQTEGTVRHYERKSFSDGKLS